MTKLTTEVTLTPKQLAEAIYETYSDDLAEMFEHLHELYGDDHSLMMHFLCTRDHCMGRGGIHGKAMSAFQSMFSSAYKYMW